jgi:hypothetical protein
MKDVKVKVDYKAPIRGIAKVILSLLTKLSTLFLNRIQDLEIRMIASGLLQSASDTIEVLSDQDPNDGEQLRKVFNKLLSTGDFKKGFQLELLEKIQKLPDEHARQALTILNANVFPVADLLTDEEKDNSAQIKTHLVNFLRGEEGMQFLSSLFKLVLPPAVADTLVVVIIETLINFLDNNDVEDLTAESREAILVKLNGLKREYEAKMAA